MMKLEDIQKLAEEFGRYAFLGQNGIVYYNEFPVNIMWLLCGKKGHKITGNDYLWLHVRPRYELSDNKFMILPPPPLYSERYLRMRGWLMEDLVGLKTIIAQMPE